MQFNICLQQLPDVGLLAGSYLLRIIEFGKGVVVLTILVVLAHFACVAISSSGSSISIVKPVKTPLERLQRKWYWQA